MKKLFIMGSLLLIIPSLSSRPIFEFSPGLSFYQGETEIFDGTSFGLVGNVIYNPTNDIGLRFTIGEVTFGSNTAILINSGFLNSISTLDILIYKPFRNLNTYVNTGLSVYKSGGGNYNFSLTAGFGLQHQISSAKTFFLEPSFLTIFNKPHGLDYFLFRFLAGIRLGL